MDNLLQQLEEGAGLTKDQSVKALTIVKKFMDKEGIKIDWNSFFKDKYDDMKGETKSLFDTIADKAHEYSNKIGDKAEDLTTQAKRTVRDLSQKASDYMDDAKK